MPTLPIPSLPTRALSGPSGLGGRSGLPDTPRSAYPGSVGGHSLQIRSAPQQLLMHQQQADRAAAHHNGPQLSPIFSASSMAHNESGRDGPFLNGPSGPPSARPGTAQQDHGQPFQQQPPPKAAFLSLFDHFYDSLADSRILQSNLEDQIRRSAALLGTLQQSSAVFEGLLERRMADMCKSLTADLQVLEGRIERLEHAFESKAGATLPPLTPGLASLQQQQQVRPSGPPTALRRPVLSPHGSSEFLAQRRASAGHLQQQQQQQAPHTGPHSGHHSQHNSRRQSLEGDAQPIDAHHAPSSASTVAGVSSSIANRLDRLERQAISNSTHERERDDQRTLNVGRSMHAVSNLRGSPSGSSSAPTTLAPIHVSHLRESPLDMRTSNAASAAEEDSMMESAGNGSGQHSR